MKRHISQSEYYQLLGLLTVARRQLELLEGVQKAAREITGDEEYGHTDDAIFCNYEIDDLLGLLEIEVVEAGAT